jgi:cytochrome oxidase Cu insertion factor (SCO1/SenC/PrrC family)
MKRPWLLSVFGVTLLSVPVVATLVARAHHGALPHLGEVPAFTLTDQAGRPLATRDLDGKVWVADFIFTSCSQVCPRLTGEMAKLQRYLINRGADGRVQLVSITVDPERDTPERLAAYAAGFQADARVWKFVTGPMHEVEDAVVRGFKMGMEKQPDENDGFSIVHGTRLVLVDGKRAIRGYYDAADAMQMERLRIDLSQLLERGGT